MLGHALENDLQFVATSEHWPAFHEKIKRMGAIGEIWFEQSISSPSFQVTVFIFSSACNVPPSVAPILYDLLLNDVKGIISPTGIVQALSTHEQVLEGRAVAKHQKLFDSNTEEVKSFRDVNFQLSSTIAICCTSMVFFAEKYWHGRVRILCKRLFKQFMGICRCSGSLWCGFLDLL